MSDDDGVPLRQRAAGAAVAACVSAVVVNPLDVVKTRIQAQGAFATVKNGGGGFTAQPALVGANHVCPPRCPTTGNLSKLCAPECNVYTSTYDVLRKIWRQEGPAALFRGTSTALAIAVPTVGIYLPCYDVCLGELKKRLGASEWGREYAPLAPVAAGAASRTLAVLCVAPLDLVRVRTQAMKTGGGGGGGGGGARGGPRVPGLWQGLAASAAGDRGAGASSEGSNESIWKNGARSGGVVRRLWTGVAPSLASGRALLGRVLARGGDAARRPRGGCASRARGGRHGHRRRRRRQRRRPASTVTGALTAALTTPLDVVKTRVQIRDVPKDFAGGIPADPVRWRRTSRGTEASERRLEAGRWRRRGRRRAEGDPRGSHVRRSPRVGFQDVLLERCRTSEKFARRGTMCTNRVPAL